MTRAAPLWARCDVCGQAAGLPGPDGLPRCPDCERRAVLADAARASLETLAAPVVGAWAAQWQAAGVALSTLADLAEDVSGAWMNTEDAHEYRRAALRRLARQHAPGPFLPHRPARLAFDLDTLPLLADVRAPDAREARPRFVTGEGQQVYVYAGPDVAIVSGPDGVRAVLPIAPLPSGAPSDAFRVPPHLWDAVALALSGPDAFMLTLEAARVDGEDLALTAFLPTLPTRYTYRLPRLTRRTVESGEGEARRVTFKGPHTPTLTVSVPASLWATLAGGPA